MRRCLFLDGQLEVPLAAYGLAADCEAFRVYAPRAKRDRDRESPKDDAGIMR
jgi:hypothetical protein